VDLGAVGGFAEVMVNGTAVPIASLGGRPADITPMLERGKNTLVVRVATTVTNRIAASAQSGDIRYAQFLPLQKQPYGLLGPVTLEPYVQARIDSSTRRLEGRR
jgi:hypothetical protein